MRILSSPPIRWVNYKKQVTTDMIKEYRESNNCSLRQAQVVLSRPRTVLEYYDMNNHEWIEVPTEEVIVDER